MEDSFYCYHRIHYYDFYSLDDVTRKNIKEIYYDYHNFFIKNFHTKFSGLTTSEIIKRL